MGLARRIEREDHKAKRVQQGNNWFVQQAKAMDIELDEDLYPCGRGGTWGGGGGWNFTSHWTIVAMMR